MAATLTASAGAHSVIHNGTVETVTRPLEVGEWR
jgi:hypothetical protein